MVRASTLPMRTLALRYGADIVYTDEMVDVGMMNADRRINGKVQIRLKTRISNISNNGRFSPVFL